MSTGSVPQTAQIIQFGGRKVLLTSRRPSRTDLEKQAAVVAVSDAWYHAAAIRDTKLSDES